MKKIIMILAGIMVLYYACNDDSTTETVVRPEVRFSEFLDLRDSNVYRCITVGDQTWMAENLRYRLDMGALQGCYTFEEEVADTFGIVVSAQTFKSAALEALDKGEITGEEQGLNLVRTYCKNPLFAAKQIIVLTERNGYPDISAQLVELNAGLVQTVAKALVALKFDAAEEKNGGYAEKYGFLYTHTAAEEAVPEGWRLPTDDDWKKLEAALGMPAEELDRLDEWRGNGQGRLLKEGTEGIGFDAKLAGAKFYSIASDIPRFWDRGTSAYFWSATKVAESDTTTLAITRGLFVNSDQILKGSSRTSAAYHVRCIKE